MAENNTNKYNIQQYRFYGTGNINNNPRDVEGSSLKERLAKEATDSSILIGGYNQAPIKQLGIQSLPGTKFYINESDNPVILGKTGIFELNCMDMAYSITKLTFDIESLRRIDENDNDFLIIDIIEENNEGGGEE